MFLYDKCNTSVNNLKQYTYYVKLCFELTFRESELKQTF
jgi:hypothetical protein